MASLQIGMGVYAETSIAAAATTDLVTAVPTLKAQITSGAASITSFGASANRIRFLRFATAVTLTHSASLFLPNGGSNIVTAVGDTCTAFSDASGNWRVVNYQRASGLPVAAAWRVLAHDAAGWALTGVAATETNLRTIAVPANAIGLNGALRLWTEWSFVNTTANSKAARIRFGGASATVGTLFLNNSATASLSAQDCRIMHNVNATNVQKASFATFNSINLSASAKVAGAIDTTAAWNIYLNGFLTDATDTIRLESYLAEVYAQN